MAMDPLSALIGGVFSLGGGLLNSSSTQSINAANLQNQMWSAEGGYLPGLVQNANKAGLNPLAVLGSRGPNMAVQVGTQPGAGLEQAGRIMGQMQDPELHDIQKQNAKDELEKTNLINKNTQIKNRVDEFTMRGIERGDFVPPGVSEPSIQGAAVRGTRGKSISDLMPNFGPIDSWEWMKPTMDFYKQFNNGVYDRNNPY